MWLHRFLSSAPGRILQVIVGVNLIWLGATDHTLTGVVRLMVGLVPVVTGITNLWPVDDPRP